MEFHHIGIATDDIDNLIVELNSILDIEDISNTIFDELQKANLCMLTLKDGTKIELISGKVVENIIRKKNYLYHTCFVTDNLEEDLNKLLARGAMQISEIKEAILFDNKRVVFLSWKLGIMELVER